MLLGSRRRTPATSAGQVVTLLVLVLLYGGLVFASVLWFPVAQTVPAQALSGQPASYTWQEALVFAGGVCLAYALLGLAGLWLAGKLDLPGAYRERAGAGALLLQPLFAGLTVGIFFLLVDTVFATQAGWTGFSHPSFPLSLLASASAGVGEEIIFRAFVLGLWAFAFNRLLGRGVVPGVSLWLGNIVAALAFAAGHVPSMMVLVGAESLADVPQVMLAELLVLNGTLGLVAGHHYLRNGLVAAVGVHFWTDVVWHVIWPLTGLAG